MKHPAQIHLTKGSMTNTILMKVKLTNWPSHSFLAVIYQVLHTVDDFRYLHCTEKIAIRKLGLITVFFFHFVFKIIIITSLFLFLFFFLNII